MKRPTIVPSITMANVCDIEEKPDTLSAVLPVAEHFVSINGEGQQAGKLSAFLRFVGCNLHCSYCDTQWACQQTAPYELMSIAEIVAFVQQAGVECVTLTGGEPALQPNLPALVQALVTMPLNEQGSRVRWIEVETNGSISLEPFVRLRESLCGQDARANRAASSKGAALGPARGQIADPAQEYALHKTGPRATRQQAGRAHACLSLTMDYKTASSGMEACMNPDNFALLKPYDTVKFVVGTIEDLEVMERVIHQYDLASRCLVYVSPVFGQIEPAQIVAFMRQHNLFQVRLQLQLHKIIWPHRDRGV